MNRRSIFALLPLALMAGVRAFAGEFKRRGSIPKEIIARFGLQEAHGGLTVLGEDGVQYSIDDAFWVLFQVAKVHWQK